MSWPTPVIGSHLSADIASDRDGASHSVQRSCHRGVCIQEPDSVALKVCELSEQGTSQKDLEGGTGQALSVCASIRMRGTELADRDSNSVSKNERTSRVFIVPQDDSRSPLLLTPDCLQALLAKTEAFSGVAKVLEAFVPDGTDFYISRGACHFSPYVTEQVAPIVEMCTLLKFVEQNDHGHGVFGYSVRQMALYQNYGISLRCDNVVLFNPSSEVWRRLEVQLLDARPAAKSWEHWTYIPLLCCMSLAAGWPDYISELHKSVSSLSRDTTFYPAGDHKGTDRRDRWKLDTQTLKSSMAYRERLQQAAHVLQNNRETLWALLEESGRRKQQDVGHQGTEYHVFQRGIEDVIRELTFVQNQVQLIMQKLEKTTDSFRDVAAMENSRSMSQMTVSTGQMTAKSIIEAQAVRVIALVTFLLLPPTFTTGFMEMNFIHDIEYHNGQLSLQADAGLLFYLAITVPLMLLVIGGWFWWDLRTRRRSQLAILEMA